MQSTFFCTDARVTSWVNRISQDLRQADSLAYDKKLTGNQIARIQQIFKNLNVSVSQANQVEEKRDRFIVQMQGIRSRLLEFFLDKTTFLGKTRGFSNKVLHVMNKYTKKMDLIQTLDNAGLKNFEPNRNLNTLVDYIVNSILTTRELKADVERNLSKETKQRWEQFNRTGQDHFIWTLDEIFEIFHAVNICERPKFSCSDEKVTTYINDLLDNPSKTLQSEKNLDQNQKDRIQLIIKQLKTFIPSVNQGEKCRDDVIAQLQKEKNKFEQVEANSTTLLGQQEQFRKRIKSIIEMYKVKIDQAYVDDYECSNIKEDVSRGLFCLVNSSLLPAAIRAGQTFINNLSESTRKKYQDCLNPLESPIISWRAEEIFEMIDAINRSKKDSAAKPKEMTSLSMETLLSKEKTPLNKMISSKEMTPFSLETLLSKEKTPLNKMISSKEMALFSCGDEKVTQCVNFLRKNPSLIHLLESREDLNQRQQQRIRNILSELEVNCLFNDVCQKEQERDEMIDQMLADKNKFEKIVKEFTTFLGKNEHFIQQITSIVKQYEEKLDLALVVKCSRIKEAMKEVLKDIVKFFAESILTSNSLNESFRSHLSKNTAERWLKYYFEPGSTKHHYVWYPHEIFEMIDAINLCGKDVSYRSRSQF